MFYQCSSLTSLNLSNFNIQNVVNMYSMFYRCNSLSYIDISNFIVKNNIELFNGLPENCTVKMNIRAINKISIITNSCEIIYISN